MTKKGSADDLASMHKLLTDYLSRGIRDGDIEKARLAVTFLKNNAVTSDPAQDEALSNLREQLQKSRIDQRLRVIGREDKGDA